jgi:hypothetical protein
MGHTIVVESEPADPRPFVHEADTSLHWQARCSDCDWVGPVRQESEHEAYEDASAHEAST